MIKDYVVFADNSSLEAALNNNIVDTALMGGITEQNFLSKDYESKFKLLSPNQYKPEIKIYFAYTLKKGDTELLNALNEKLEDMKNDGTLYQILVKYGTRDRYIQ